VPGCSLDSPTYFAVWFVQVGWFREQAAPDIPIDVVSFEVSTARPNLSRKLQRWHFSANLGYLSKNKCNQLSMSLSGFIDMVLIFCQFRA
jgi:hypothetical protein